MHHLAKCFEVQAFTKNLYSCACFLRSIIMMIFPIRFHLKVTIPSEFSLNFFGFFCFVFVFCLRFFLFYLRGEGHSKQGASGSHHLQEQQFLAKQKIYPPPKKKPPKKKRNGKKPRKKPCGLNLSNLYFTFK